MSRILRRPMFRGGGKVSSYGNGIATGLASGGRVNLRVGGNPAALVNLGSGAGAPTQSVMNTGGNILTRNLNKLIPTKAGILNALSKGAKLPVVGALGTYGGAAGIGTGMGQLADFYAKSTSTPEGYRRLKEMGSVPFMFDETNIDVGDAFKYIDEGNMIGEKPGFFPRGGKKKFYEDRGYNPDGTLKKIIEDQTTKDSALETAEENPNKEITVDDKTGEPVLTKKEILEQKAKEYEEILGAGIKKDSIFDAMIEGGTRLYEGEGAGAAIRAANKALDPIQNIKTASRKLAVEEDIAIRKALAVAKGKSNATRDLIEQYKKAGLNDREIANRLSNNEIELEVIVQKMGSKPEGYKEFVRKKYPGVNILQETDPKKIDTSVLDDGRHYITYPTDAFIEVKDGKLVGKIDYR